MELFITHVEFAQTIVETLKELKGLGHFDYGDYSETVENAVRAVAHIYIQLKLCID